MEIISQSISNVRTIRPSYFHDHRGYFVESYNKKKFAECGINIEFVQDNLSFMAKNGTVKGLHFQARPFEQWKLISVVAGSVFDVAVDIRKGSPTYGKYVGSVLDSENGTRPWYRQVLRMALSRLRMLHGCPTVRRQKI